MRKEVPLLSLPRVAFALHAVTVEVKVPLAGGRTDPPSLSEQHAMAQREVQNAIRGDVGGTDLWSGLLSDGRRDVPATVLRDGPPPEEYCPRFNSFEIDILNYRGIQDRPVVSVCHTPKPIDVEIHVPEQTTFFTEGRAEMWEGARTPIPARLALSFSRFRHSKVRVWHVVFRPPDSGSPHSGAFSELDLIKLITLYDGTQEESNVRHDIRLSLPGRPAVPIAEFLFRLTEGTLVAASFAAGTVEVELDDDPTSSPVDWGTLFNAASQTGLSELRDELLRYGETGPARDRIVAASGIVQGIFDYDRLAVSELSEVFRPVIRSSKAKWQSINCATLLDVSVGQNFLDVTEDSFGISPYLAIPHAVALHNEFVARAAEAHTNVAAKQERGIASLSRAAEAAQRLLHRLIVPNVFLYASEHELLDHVTEHRGAATLREVALSKLAELEGRLDREKALSAARRAHWLAAFLSILSLGVLLDAVTFYKEHLNDSLSLSLGVTLVLIAAIVLGGLYAYAQPRR